jgi:hypothetical protein
MELFKANRQWSTRPADQRFESLTDLYNVTKHYAEQARETNVPWSTMRAEAIEGDVQLVGRTGVPAKLTHWAFGQMCARVDAPASYLRDLPATLAVQNLNHGLATRGKESNDNAALMFHSNGSLLLRSVTSERYSRIWNYELAARLLDLEKMGWEPARPDMHWGADTVGKCIACNGIGRDNTTDHDACQFCNGTGREYPALYASDHDMFAFVRNKSAIVREPGNPDGLQRGVIVENSEVGASSLKMTRFLYREMCGNHIIWGASNVIEISLRHIGDVRERFYKYAAQIRKYAESSASDEEAQISSAKTKILAKTKDEVLDLLFGKRLNISRKTLEAGYDAVKPDQDGDPNSAWGIVQGLTRHSQTLGYADARTAVDRAAGKILQIAF